MNLYVYFAMKFDWLFQNIKERLRYYTYCIAGNLAGENLVKWPKMFILALIGTEIYDIPYTIGHAVAVQCVQVLCMGKSYCSFVSQP